MSEMFKVELSRARAIAICVCAAGACILLFVAGAASGLLLASNAVGLQMAQAAPAGPKYEPVPAEEKTETTAAVDENSLETTDGTSDRSGNPPSLAVLSTAPKPAALPPAPPQQTAPAPAAPQSPAAPASPGQPSTGVSEANADLSQGASGYGLPLAVKVCSFSEKSSADNLATLLQSKGYRASVIRAFGAEDRVWYLVTVGPYREWNAASSAAANVAIIANVQPVVAQLR